MIKSKLSLKQPCSRCLLQTIARIIGVSLSATTLICFEVSTYNFFRRPEIVTHASSNIHVLGSVNFEDGLQQFYCDVQATPIKESKLHFSEADELALMKIAKAEHGNTDAYGQALIMMTVINRLHSKKFPNSIKGILSQNRQFTTVSNGSYKKAIPDSTTKKALILVETGKVKSKALYFEASWLKGSWQSKHRKHLFEYKGTRYYK
jgi:hypothetical protein